MSWLSHCVFAMGAFRFPFSPMNNASVLLIRPGIVNAYLNEESSVSKGENELKNHQKGIQNERN
jgi:hypothetical protein